ncbi:NAD kinase [Paludibacter jiangxiensis]|uniref:NAD kinase n=1 Tax=Paludibacter jiangxiensis TaxID=681398 RepID=A0A171AIC2_9BACT|nr:NAD kinase [Paludibacter jiangxiensis]GAT63786.1 NAD+ kinase [Paludibacter jiangxiensis]
MKIALFGNTFRQEAIDTATHLLTTLQKKNIEVLIEASFFDFLKNAGCDITVSPENTINDGDFSADIALSLGGDGTFLNTAKHVGSKGIPILGINAGRLGFLSDVADNEIEAALDEIVNHQYQIEERSVLQLITDNSDWQEYAFALNEIALLKQDTSSMMTIHVSVKGELLNSYRADGLIISTPTGSTAYSMSVGGPIVVPQSNTFILAPVASHTLSIRPLIIPDNWELEISISSRSKSFLVALDGRSDVFPQSTNLKIRKAEHTVKVLKRANHTFFNTLKSKLMWGADKRME